VDTYLPDPHARISGRKYWKRCAVREYLAKIAGEPAPAPQPDDHHLVGSLELRLILGGVSDMWLHRHSRRSVIGSPPAVNPPDQAA
jgi:hypothetical protein